MPEVQIFSVMGNHRFAVARYDSDGNLDTTFGGGGIAVSDFGPGSPSV